MQFSEAFQNSRHNSTVYSKIQLELGSSPGSWTQFLRQKYRAKILAVDLSPMEPVLGVEFIQSDFSLISTRDHIKKQFPGGIDLLARLFYRFLYIAIWHPIYLVIIFLIILLHVIC